MQHVVLLGASNASRGIATITHLLQHNLGRVRVHAAIGRSRAYSQRSAFLLQDLPPIRDSALWHQLDAHRVHQPLAVVTDIGNDILYGATPGAVLEALDLCLTRLDARGSRVVLTRMPMHNVDRLGPRQIQYLQWLAPVGKGMSVEVLIDRARQLDEGIAELSRAHGTQLVSQEPNWYGDLDPIHFALARAPEAWRAILAPVTGPLNLPPRPGMRAWMAMQFAPNPERTVLGRRSTHAGPSHVLAGGSELYLF